MSKKTHKYNKTKRKGNNKTKRKGNTIKKIHDYANKGIKFLSKINNSIHVINNLIDTKEMESDDPPFICFISSILSRLAYNRNGILDDYLTIFHDNIINNDFLIDIKNNNINDIFNNNDFFKLSNIISSKLCIEYARKINKRLLDDTRPKTFPIGVSSKNVMYISITTSNYSSVYIIADKIMNAIWVVFKGTDSPKNMSIYSKPSSLISINLCEDERDGTIGGIFKILSEIINTIMNSNICINSTTLQNITINTHLIFNNHDYIFDKIVNVPKEKENIVSHTFVLSNLLSFFIGKIFENIIHN
jgi:hypothetical protein